MKITISHSGKQHAYQVAKAMKDLRLLEHFYTSSYISQKWLQDYLLRSGDRFWSRRFLEGLHGHSVRPNWRFEFKEMLFSRIYGQTEKTLNAIFERDIKFDRYVSGKIAEEKSTLFWGFQGSCFESLKAAKKSGKVTVCELPAAHAPAAVRILREEQELHPEWADSIDYVGFPDHYFKRICEEPHLADVVVGASAFTLHTLREAGVPESKLRLLPLGFELNHIPFQKRMNFTRKGPLKLLYAGRITQRKGIKYLLEAMRMFSPDDVELHLIGNIHGSGKALKKYKNFVRHHPLQQYDLFQKYQEFDAFVLPSIFEGFGLVIVEAMAAGLPVIATPHSIAPELIEEDMNGYLIPVRDSEAIAASIQKLISKTEEERAAMHQASRQKALNYSWDSYNHRLTALLTTVDSGFPQ